MVDFRLKTPNPKTPLTHTLWDLEIQRFGFLGQKRRIPESQDCLYRVGWEMGY